MNLKYIIVAVVAAGVGSGLLLYLSEQNRHRAQEESVQANRGVIENAWAIGVAAHTTLLSDIANQRDQKSAVDATTRLRDELQGQLMSVREKVPQYAQNPTLNSLVQGLQQQIESYDNLREMLKKGRWDSVEGAILEAKLRGARREWEGLVEKVPGLRPAIGQNFDDLHNLKNLLSKGWPKPSPKPTARVIAPPPPHYDYGTNRSFSSYSCDDLWKARNTIFARHGRPFKDPTVRAYFRSQPWYQEDPYYSDSRLTAGEKSQADQYLQEERRRGCF